jgi:hypothetical protein
MRVQDCYNGAKEYGYNSLVLLIDYLVNERKVLKMTSNSEELQHYLKDKYAKAMNNYLSQYEERRK